MFPIVIIRPDNTQVISKFTEFLVNPISNHIKAVNYNIYYLVSNKYLIIEFKVKNKDGKLIAVTDKVFIVAANASYKNNPNRKSGEEHIFKLFKGAVN